MTILCKLTFLYCDPNPRRHIIRLVILLLTFMGVQASEEAYTQHVASMPIRLANTPGVIQIHLEPGLIFNSQSQNFYYLALPDRVCIYWHELAQLWYNRKPLCLISLFLIPTQNEKTTASPLALSSWIELDNQFKNPKRTRFDFSQHNDLLKQQKRGPSTQDHQQLWLHRVCTGRSNSNYGYRYKQPLAPATPNILVIVKKVMVFVG